MKTLILIILMLPFVSVGQKNKRIYRNIRFQGQFPVTHEGYFMDQYIPMEKRQEENLESITVLKEGKRGNQSKRTVTFNRLGHIVSAESEGMNVTNTYLNDSLIVKKITRSKKHIVERIYQYENEQLVGIKRKEDDKEVSQYKYAYNENGDKTESHYYFGKGQKNHYMMKNEYNEAHDLTKSMYFMNDELMKTLTYSCDDRGKELKKKEMNVGVCEYKEESNDGSYIKFERRLIRDNVYLFEKHYDKDSSFIGSKRWLNDTILIFEYTFNNGVGESSNYTAKGKYTNGWMYKYDDHKRTLERTHYLGKKKKKRISEKLTYEKDFLSSKERFFKGEKLADVKYEYTYREDS